MRGNLHKALIFLLNVNGKCRYFLSISFNKTIRSYKFTSIFSKNANITDVFKKDLKLSKRHFVKSFQIRSFFWSIFCFIWTEYGDLLSKSPYSVRIQENMDQEKLRTWKLLKLIQCTIYQQALYNLFYGPTTMKIPI